MRGYDCAATDELLAELAANHAEFERERLRLRDRTARLEAELERYRRRDEVLNKSLLAASTQAMSIREEARREAALVLRKARAKAAKHAKRSERVEREQAAAEQELQRVRALTREIHKGLASLLTETLEHLGSGEAHIGKPSPPSVGDQAGLLGTLDAALKGEEDELGPSSEVASRFGESVPEN
jgi:cell division septum initiation protein DivIVA